MPNTGPVYQPTTVNYEQQGEWRNPSGLLSHTHTTIARSRCCLHWIALAAGVLAIISGIGLVATGSMRISDSETEMFTANVVILITGCILLLTGCVLTSIIVGHGNCRAGGPRIQLKEKRIANQMRDTQSMNGQAMNPSTDFLVTAQYAPVSEIAYQPPAVSEEEETRKLMGSDNKDCLLKESNSVITLSTERFESEDNPELRRPNHTKPDRRFRSPKPTNADESSNSQSSWKSAILRKASVRSKRAPLAGVEEITPSLRSSWSSMYFRTPSESESEGLSCSSDAAYDFS